MPFDLSEAKFHCRFMPGRSMGGAEPKLTPAKRASVVVGDVSSVINAKPGFGDDT
ncbi:hypothetical protein ACWC4A_43815 [Streptomyces mirabilis]